MKDFRFFITPGDVRDDSIELTGGLFHKIRNVLRYKTGDRIILVVPGLRKYSGEISDIGDGKVTVRILQSENTPEIAVSTTLYLSLIKAGNFEAAIMKATELGVKKVVPVAAMRSVVKIRKEQAAGKIMRWQAIATEAASQCRRTDIPAISTIIEAGELADIRDDAEIKILCNEKDGAGLKDCLGGHQAPLSISAAVGPEGGFTREEVEAFTKAGFRSVILAGNILRSETVPVFLMSVIQYEFGG